MVFCAYCGKSFTRKEHLERHLPIHTNVKPHICSGCQLSFSRRDLLQRHYTTYHEPRDPLEPLPGGIPTVPGKTPIACQNCASAKTGCDKRVPCTRCAEKNLDCTARFARRSSKAAMRAAQAGQVTAMQNSILRSPPPLALPNGTTINPSLIGEKPQDAIVVAEPKALSSPQKASPMHAHVSPGCFASPHVGNIDDLAFADFGDVGPHDQAYQDYMLGSGAYAMDLDMYHHQNIPLRSLDISMPALWDYENISPSSEPMTASSSRASMHTRETSISTNEFDSQIKPEAGMLPLASGGSSQEFDNAIETEGWWNLARCNKQPPSLCQSTAILHLECLERKGLEQGTWRPLEEYLKNGTWDASDMSSVVPLSPVSREQVLAVTQGFLDKALAIHRGRSRRGGDDFNYIVLPPSHILEHFLQSYVRSLSVYYPLVAAGRVDPNEMLENNKASTLLVLLMIAQGAAAMPVAEAHYLSAGLTETCRISLFDTVEKDLQPADPIALRCALLFIVLGAWSGDKWLMDTAMGQRGMYMSMLKCAGMMEPQPSMISIDDSNSREIQWRAWMEKESRNRLVYNYVMLDQELSLFHDTAPLFAITDIRCPLPAAEALWRSTDAEHWFAARQSVYGISSSVNPQLLPHLSVTPSLHDLFKEFLTGSITVPPGGLSPQQLRLILHPIQAMLCHLRQLLSCFDSDLGGSLSRNPDTVTKSSTMERVDEVQTLLKRWYKMAMEYSKGHPDCPVTRCNLVLYHLVSLNALTNFPEIERLARREGYNETNVLTSWDITLSYKRCIFQREEAILHCGQVFRLLRLMPTDRRPAWWTVAMYRATLVLWVDSLSRLDLSFQVEKSGLVEMGSGSGVGPYVVIDQMTLEDQALIAYQKTGQGAAVLTRWDLGLGGDGMPMRMTLDKPGEVLEYTIKNIESVTGYGKSQIGDGIRRKLVELQRNWNEENIGGFFMAATSS